MNQKHLDADELLLKALYIMVSVASTDDDFAEEELHLIVGKTSFFNHFQLSITPYVLSQVMQQYEQDNPKERRLNLLRFTSDVCSNPAAKSALLNDLEAIIDADGKVCSAELAIYRDLRNHLL